MKKWYSIIIISCCFISSVTAQTTVTISAAADNTIYQNPSANSNALGQNIFSGNNGGGSPRRGLIKFDVAAVIPAGASIVSVTLTLNCNNSRAVADNVSLYKLLSNWGEGTSNAGATGDGAGVAATATDATWLTTFFPASLWTTPGGDYNPVSAATTTINSTGFFTWSSANMVSDVQSWLSTPATNYGWILLCNEAATGTARRFASKENAVIANRPSLSVTYSTTLPVTLTRFTANVKNAGVLLSWETAQEINNRSFEILHSRDGLLFSSIGQLPGQGNSSIKHEYQFTHTITTAGNHFYKLAQIDFDGNQKQSKIERVHITVVDGNMKIMPNPVLSEFTISSTTDLQNTNYDIINQQGAVVASGVTRSNTIKAGFLKAGTYYLCIYKNNKLINRMSFVKL
jgi:Secretion system C-terminal sorting domain